MPDTLTHSCHLSTREAGTGVLWIQGQSGLHSEALSHKPKIQNKAIQNASTVSTVVGCFCTVMRLKGRKWSSGQSGHYKNQGLDNIDFKPVDFIARRLKQNKGEYSSTFIYTTNIKDAIFLDDIILRIYPHSKASLSCLNNLSSCLWATLGGNNVRFSVLEMRFQWVSSAVYQCIGKAVEDLTEAPFPSVPPPGAATLWHQRHT